MTPAWAIKGPYGGNLALGLSETAAWAVVVIGTGSSKETLMSGGYTCVPVTLVEGSAEPVAWIAADSANPDGCMVFKPGRHFPVGTEFYTAPPADDARRLLEECKKRFENIMAAVNDDREKPRHELEASANGQSALGIERIEEFFARSA